MESRPLGDSGLTIAPLILGGNVFGWTVDERASFGILDAFLSSGFNCIDTADVYSRWAPGNTGGESETIIGSWLRKRRNREKVVIATKVGSQTGTGGSGLSRGHILRAVEDSLRRLQTEYIDLYQTHRDDPSTPVEETLEAYAQLVREGKVRAIGASNLDSARLSASIEASNRLGYPRYASMQPQYSLCERAGYEKELQAVCASLHLAVIPYFPLASGFLTGKYRTEKDLDKSVRGKEVRKYLNERGLRILSALDFVAGQCRSTPAAISLAWLLSKPGVTAPVVSVTATAQWEELATAPRLRMDDALRELLDRASA